MAGAAMVYLIVILIVAPHNAVLLRGWGVPMATDVGLAVGVLNLFHRSVPVTLRTFLLLLAAADDVGSVIALAIFGHQKVHVIYVCFGLLVVVGCGLMLRKLRRFPVVLSIAALFLTWWSFGKAGVDPPLAGICIGLLAPPATKPIPTTLVSLNAMATSFAYLIVLPIFAFANLGVALPLSLSGTKADVGVAGAILLARLVGKPVGVILGILIGQRIERGKFGVPQEGASMQWIAAGVICSMGATVPLLYAQAVFLKSSLYNAAAGALIEATILGGIVGACLLGAQAFGRRSLTHGIGHETPVPPSPQ
jgi:NhaA family Na+:H+ antiporter